MHTPGLAITCTIQCFLATGALSQIRVEGGITWIYQPCTRRPPAPQYPLLNSTMFMLSLLGSLLKPYRATEYDPLALEFSGNL